MASDLDGNLNICRVKAQSSRSKANYCEVSSPNTSVGGHKHLWRYSLFTGLERRLLGLEPSKHYN